MVYKRFLWGVAMQQIILTLTLLMLCWTIFKPRMIITSVNLGILALFEVLYLIHYLNKTNRDLARLFDAFRFQDGTMTFNTPKKKDKFSSLYLSFERMLNEFRDLRGRLEREKYFYLNTLNHIGIGLIVVAQDGTVRFSNRAVQRMTESGQMDTLMDLDTLKPGLGATILKMSASSRELIKVVLHHEVVQLSVRCSMFRIDKELYRIISFQDIKIEIEKNEADAWQKLIRILTHEIMNSVSPITLTSSGIIRMLEKDGRPLPVSSLDDTILNQVLTGLQAIRKRGRGLASFVENYQAVNHVPQPVLTLIHVSGLFSHLEMIMREELQKNHVRMETIVAPVAMMLHADERLISQVLINLIRNALQAMDKLPYKQIQMAAFQMEDQVRISVTDNGKGIPPELLDSVFVPFYTTREQGSGIGLSLSREIMKLHGGGIRVNSIPGKETTFTLLF
jgi:two-component system, NtrC family, nitrogen regulation sensor histidine kinase NtrY